MVYGVLKAGTPAGTRTQIDGLGNRSSIQLNYRSALGGNVYHGFLGLRSQKDGTVGAVVLLC